MSTQSAAPPSARFVLFLLIFLGTVFLAIAGSAIGWISYNYITRPELRDPVPVEKSSEGHSFLPGWTIES